MDELHDEGAGGLYETGGLDLFGEEENDGDAELDSLAMPAACTRGISCLSMRSVRTEDGLGIELDGDGGGNSNCASSDSWVHSIARVAAWMDGGKDDSEEERCAARDIDDVSKLVATHSSSSTAPAAGGALSCLPLPKTFGMDWAAFQERSSSFNARVGAAAAPSGLLAIPKLSREILIEGMAPQSRSPADIKKQKIARYLEKRQRRLLKRKRPHTTTTTGDVTYQARRDIANKRARQNGRFVSTSEFGQAPRRRR